MKGKRGKDGSSPVQSDKLRLNAGQHSASQKQEEDSKKLVKGYLESRKAMQEALGRELIEAARNFDHENLSRLISQGAPVNYQDKETLATALHFAAAYGDRKSILLLLKTRECDLLLKDRYGRLPSSLANTGGNDPAAARLLSGLQNKQAQERGIGLAIFRYEP